MSKNEKKNKRKINLTETAQNAPQLKERFLQAVSNGELGTVEKEGTVVTLKAFKAYFSDIKTQYVSSFLPAATFEPGQCSVTHTKFVFRLRRGVYLLHSDALKPYRE